MAVKLEAGQVKLDLPREKLNKKGAHNLTDLELLQAVIGSGTRGNDFRQVAKNLHAKIESIGIDALNLEDVKSIKGIGTAKGTVVFAALEYCRRRLEKQTRPMIDSPEKASEQLDFIRNKKQEHFVCMTLDGARQLINKHIISVGTLTATLVHPREVFEPAITDRAASIIIAHNHPSGSLEVSAQDREVTLRIKDAGILLGIHLDDHLVVSEEGFASAY